MAIQFGNTWWGKQWLNAFSNIDFSNRLPRGRSYARNGSVLKFSFTNNAIAASVQGTRPIPYRVKIASSQFSGAERTHVLNTILENPAFLSKLLSRELPPDLKDALERKGVNVFPRNWRDIDATCTCPDYAVPCKHIAAVIYLIANEIDKNPFQVFGLHGMDLLAEIEKAGYSGAQKAMVQMPSVAGIIESLLPEPPAQVPDMALLNGMDYSTVPEIRNELLSLLTPNPLFYPEGDFKKVLEKALRNIGAEAARHLARLDTPPEQAPEVYPETVTAIRIITDRELNCSTVQLHTLPGEHTWKRADKPLDTLLGWLAALPPNQLHRYSHAVQALAAAYRLSLVLLRQGAVTPAIVDIGEGEYAITWHPATLRTEVAQLVERLDQVLPPGVLAVALRSGKEPQLRYFPAGMQAAQLLGMAITQLVRRWEGALPIYNEVQDAFFSDHLINAHEVEHRETPSLIHLWLKRFYLSKKEVVPVIQIEEGRRTDFVIRLLVNDTRQPMREPVPLQEIFSNLEYTEIKLPVLQDLAVLTEYFPRLNTIIASQGADSLEVNGNEFADIFLRVLPVIRLLGIGVLLPKSLQRLLRPALSMAIDGESKGVEKHFLSMDELLRYKWQVSLGNEQLSPEEFLKLVKGVSGIVKIRDQYVMVDPNEVRQLIDKLENPPKLKGADLLQVALTETYDGAPIQLSEAAKAILRELLEIKNIALPQGLRADLRPYQLRGFEWLYKNSRIGFGSIIADDMGLGKTLQVITTLLKFKEEGYLTKKKALAIVPTTLLTNWQKEVQRFAPNLSLHVYHGSSRKLPGNDVDLVLTTYGVARSDEELLSRRKWYVAVIDEAQNIKNPGTAQTKAIKKLKADVHIAMSGTPVENRLSEYWSILDFTNKGYLGSLKSFQRTYAYPIEVEQDQQQLKHFQKATAPFIMRRVKSDKRIISDLPDKVELNEFCTLTPDQAALYQNVVDEMLKQVEESEGIDRSGLVFKLIMALKQICNHPVQFLKSGVAEPAHSGKSGRLLELLNGILENDEKVLVFTQFQQMGELLQQMIRNQFHTEALFLHGGCSRKQRDEMVEQIQHERAAKVMILSLKAGGTGLNLTAANNVIHYDLWWNPAVEAQATDRAFRIGQRKNVFVHRLLTQGTFEEKINAMLKEKRELADLAVSQGEQWIGELSNRELNQLFRLG
jgi:uncharacterized Zn finger protein